jgi:hypothetical protein
MICWRAERMFIELAHRSCDRGANAAQRIVRAGNAHNRRCSPVGRRLTCTAGAPRSSTVGRDGRLAVITSGEHLRPVTQGSQAQVTRTVKVADVDERNSWSAHSFGPFGAEE